MLAFDLGNVEDGSAVITIRGQDYKVDFGLFHDELAVAQRDTKEAPRTDQQAAMNMVLARFKMPELGYDATNTLVNWVFRTRGEQQKALKNGQEAGGDATKPDSPDSTAPPS